MIGSYVIGIDFGTDSVRSIIVDTANGRQVASSEFYYPRWREGRYCNASINQFRQHPRDYVEGIEYVIKAALAEAGYEVRAHIRALSIDTTGSTPVAVNQSGTPLALLPDFQDDPDAMFVLWKDHTSAQEMTEINDHAKQYGTNYLKNVGGIYSSEWFWSKLLHILRKNVVVRNACYSWVEHCDWMPFLLTGGKDVSEMKRNVCTAGHKALWSEEWGGLAPDKFFSALDPLLSGFTGRLFNKTFTADQKAGTLCGEWAERLGLSIDVIVGVGAMDAHMGAVGGQIGPFYLSKVIGTSTCDMLVAPVDDIKGTVPGICGQVNGSIIPGMMGMEAGQSAFGDVFAWFKNLVAWPFNLLVNEELHGNNFNILEKVLDKIIPELSRQAAQIPLTEDAELSIDWFNGRRTPDANPFLKGSITGLSLASDAPRIFRSLAEATCFGSKAILDRFIQQGIPILGLIGIGGIARKSPFVMQMLADVTNMPVKVNRSEQTSALGAAMFAATVAGIYSKIEDSMNAMGQGFDLEYHPNKERVPLYQKRYIQYEQTGCFFEEVLNQNK